MRIFFSVQKEPDYGIDIIYGGLASILGPDNVLEYPTKSTYHGKRYNSKYPCFFNFYRTKNDEQKLEMLRNDEYSFIVITCFVENPKKAPILKIDEDLYELLKEKSKKIPTFLLDQGDRRGIREDLVKDFNCRLYFKREYFGEENAVPLSYSYFLTEVDLDKKRNNDFFWAGSFNSYRKEFLETFGASRETFGVEEYKKRILDSRIGLNLRGFGFDTVRHYEIPAHGTLLLSERLPIIVENEFVDNESAVFFSTVEELKDKMRYLLDNPDVVDRIRKNGYERFNKYHTNIVRARQLLERMKSESI